MSQSTRLLICLCLLPLAVFAGQADLVFENGFEQPAPQPAAFEGIALAYSPEPGAVTLEWFAASDDTTPPEAMQYRIYRGGADLAADIETGQQPDTVLVGEVKYTYEGLTPDVQSWFAVVAVDEDGIVSPGLHVVGVTPAAEPLVTRNEVKVLAGLGILVEQTGFDAFTLSGPGATGIGMGDFIVIENTFGRTLRQVLTVDIQGGMNHITTFKASMTDVFSSGDLRVHANLVLDNESTEGALGLPQQVQMLADANRQPRHSWYESADGRLRMETRDYGRTPRKGVKSVSRPEGEATLADGVELQYLVKASLDMAADVRWSDGIVDSPEYLKGVVTGSLSVDALAAYSITGAVNYEVEQELLSKTFSFLYTMAGVPVYQEVTVRMMAGLEFSAEAAFNMELTGHAQKDITIGFQWSETAGFSLIREDGFENVISFDLGGQAAAQGSLKIYPVISTRLYKAAQIALFVVPEFTLDAEARLIPLPVEINKFDVDFWVKGYVEADLTIFSQELARWNSDKAQLLRVPIHSQPEVALRHSTAQLDTCGTRKLFLSVADGYNNVVPPQNISWSVNPPGGTNLAISESGYVGEFSAENPGNYTINVTAYGDGFLGVLGTRYASAEINVIQSNDDPCNPNDVDVTAADVISCVPLDVGLWDSIVPSKTTIVPGESLSFDIPLYCEDGCGVTAFFGAVGRDNTPTPIGASEYLISGPLGHPLFISPPGSRLGHVYVDIMSVDFPPGIYSATNITFDGSSADFVKKAAYYDPYNHIEFGESRKSYPLSYAMNADYWPDYPFGQRETCLNTGTGIPVIPVRVVAGGLDDDEDDEPSASHEVGINTPRVRAQFDNNDDDWFDFDFDPGPHAGGVYDADAPIDTDCPVEVTVTTELDINSYAILFPDLESATNRMGALVSGKTFSYQPAPGNQYYLLAQTDHPFAGAFNYDIDVHENCDPEPFLFPMMTAPVQLSDTVVTTQGSIDITVQFTDNTDRAQAYYTNLDSGAQFSCFSQNTGLLGQTSTTLTCGAPSPAGQWVVNVTLFPENCCRQSYYVKDDLFSSENYTLRAENFPDLLRMSTDIAIPVITVNLP